MKVASRDELFEAVRNHGVTTGRESQVISRNHAKAENPHSKPVFDDSEIVSDLRKLQTP
jgi:hypothetical protein